LQIIFKQQKKEKQIMKKILTVIAVLALLFPVSAMAGMTAITDSEMADVTGQVGIDISVIDFAMDVSIANVAWGDGDSGTLIASGREVDYLPGYLNFGGIDMYIYVTLNGSPVFLSTPTATDLLAVKYGGTLGTAGSVDYFVAAQPLGIDILTAGPAGYVDAQDAGDPYIAAGNPYEATWNKTGILISIPDMYVTIDDLSLAGIYLTPDKGGVVSIFNPVAEEYMYVTSNAVAPCQSLGELTIEGIEVTTYSSVPGTSNVAGNSLAATLAAATGAVYEGVLPVKSAYELEDNGGHSERYYPNNRALVLISPHCGTHADKTPGTLYETQYWK
jgi:hypothetical protein